jgi:hypothetical protein
MKKQERLPCDHKEGLLQVKEYGFCLICGATIHSGGSFKGNENGEKKSMQKKVCPGSNLEYVWRREAEERERQSRMLLFQSERLRRRRSGREA